MQNSNEYSLFLWTINPEREEPTVMRMHLCFSPARLRGGAGETRRAREAARRKSRVAEKRGAARWRPTSGPGFLLPAGVAPGGVEPSRREGVGRTVLPLCLLHTKRRLWQAGGGGSRTGSGSFTTRGIQNVVRGWSWVCLTESAGPSP